MTESAREAIAKDREALAAQEKIVAALGTVSEASARRIIHVVSACVAFDCLDELAALVKEAEK